MREYLLRTILVYKPKDLTQDWSPVETVFAIF
jgi:hypothetical protein